MLGFFDALKSVRDANRQDVPSHLRDANRDGDAFGDGVGYRYPHAYAEHWVAQQYLPKALQGEVFWSARPTGLGRRTPGAHGRAPCRSASSLRGTGDEHPLLMSSGPEEPRWSAGFSGSWHRRWRPPAGAAPTALGRCRLEAQDRVVVLGRHSLLWALDPLASGAEGGLTILCVSKHRTATSGGPGQLLDPEHQPTVLDGLEALPSIQIFDWIGGRLGTADLLT